ncbi:hypothetical protein T484DRAFT_1842297 [Baffinella frigidus]|nr:hypothetical protein T484DRAFT_1842297 [Cryptophyta sp. CCMP2293]
MATTARVVLRSLDGLILSDAAGTVLASVVTSSGAPGGTLYGGRATMANGVAEFPDLRIVEVGLAIRLRFRFGDEVADSDAFNVVADSDAFNVISAYIRAVVPPYTWASATISGGNTSLITSGIASFPGLSIRLPGSYRLSFQCADAAGASSPTPPALAHFDGLPYGLPARVEIVSEAGAALQLYRISARPVVRLVDSLGNQVYGFQGHFGAEKQPGGAAEVLVGAGNLITQRAEWGQADLESLIQAIVAWSIQVTGTSLVNGSFALQFLSSCCSILSASPKPTKLHNPES